MLPIAPQRINVVFNVGSLIANAAGGPYAAAPGRRGFSRYKAHPGQSHRQSQPRRQAPVAYLLAPSGGHCIDDVDMLRSGDTARILEFRVKAHSTVGAFRWQNVRQLDAVSSIALKRAWDMGAGPGDRPLTIDVDSTPVRDVRFAQAGRPRPELHRRERVSPVDRQHRRERVDLAYADASGKSQHRSRRGALRGRGNIKGALRQRQGACNRARRCRL